MLKIKVFLWYMWIHFKKYKTVFLKYYGNLSSDHAAYICINLRLHVHSLEKGMSLHHVKPGFGKEKAESIIKLLKKYKSLNTNYDYSAYLLGVDMLNTYYDYMKEAGINYDFVLEALNELNVKTTNHTGVYCLSKEQIYKSVNDFESFTKSRHSVRYFSKEKLDFERVEKAIQLAQTAPSACNRQSCSVYLVKEEDKLKRIMEAFKGTAGLENVQAILCIVSDLNHYFGLSQSNAQYVDGGLFTMNLLHSLHYYEMATCPLIWSDNDDAMEKIRNITGIKDNHIGICAIAIGNYPDDMFRVAKSHRRESEQIIHII